MHPQFIFTIFGNQYTIASYSLFAFLGAIIGISTALPLLKREGLSYKKAFFMLLISTASFLVGARLLNYVINPRAYGNQLHLYSWRFAGFSVYGGIIGVFCTILIYSKIGKINLEKMLDAMVIPSGLAFILARVGCFLNGCCGGKATTSCFGVVFPVKASDSKVISKIVPFLGKIEVAVFPTQLFEAGLAFVGLLPIVWLYMIRKKEKVQGTYFLLYAVWFSGMRLFVLQFRELPYHTLIINVFYPLLYILIIVIGLVLLQIKTRKA